MPYRTHVMVCAGTECATNQSFKIKEVFEEELKKKELQNEVLIVMTGCKGSCAVGPVVIVMPDEVFYQKVKPEDVPHLVEEHLLKGRPVQKLMYKPPEEKVPVPTLSDIDFFKRQTLIVLRNRGLIDPEKIDEYIARDGYKALAKALSQMKPQEVIEEIKKSGLRGRGGGGFPTGRKWESRAKMEGDFKYIVCNADEGDPGAFCDRSAIESDPHSVLEGMIIGAYAIGACKGYIYTRNEYPLAIERLEKAIDAAREYGLLGEGIFDTNFSFDISIFRGAGAFVCGETTALVASIEGKPPEPRQRPPRTALWGRPTVINNVETWATVPQIILRGSEWFASIGTEKSKGTKIFSLVGNINDAGLVEVPMGITLREIIYEIGGGIPKKKKFKAVQTGGPSGGCLPESLLDQPVDYDSLIEAGSMMGSGGMIIMDENTCMVDVARYFTNFLKDESCGKCASCRDGLIAMSDVLEDICKGEGKESDIELLEDLAQTVSSASLCGLGKTAGNPVRSTLRYFKDEYLAHVKDKKCPGGVCKVLIEYHIDAEKCKACGLCIKACPNEAITGAKKTAHVVEQAKCLKCGACHEACKFEAVVIR
ncbi:MAG: NADH-ubiquinone oxidoreductase-F iron-sulfur binding region domain-containing protein [Candidatus Eremiobacteraeota bacterium]|nr:NADH-ubiquinone oxidoreductase-F iron-sulfur binding region domain-containing protein [Candidatus Eremiobacteraeota bacterium]